MPELPLPNTRGCLVCGRDNPHGIYLRLKVDPVTGIVTSSFTPAVHHMGFQGIVHGGLLSTLLDEAMVWAAIWSGKRLCVCGELNVRFRQSVLIGQPIQIEAKITATRSRLIEATGRIVDSLGKRLVESTAKYVPLSDERNRQFLASLVPEPVTEEAIRSFVK